MQIKTIAHKDATLFDTEVNQAIADGWTLVKRDVITTTYGWAYYAELVKLDPPAEPELMPWQEAARVLTDTCTGAEECSESCPMYDWCEVNLPGNALPPNEWVTPMPGEAVQL